MAIAPMRIMYLTQWFLPEPNIVRGVRFVRALEAAGHQVTVVTGLPNYPRGKLYDGYRLRPIQRERIDGVEVVRLPLYPSHDLSALRRSLNFLSFFVAALLYCLFRRARFDVAYVYHPPVTVGLAAALAGKIRRLPFVIDIQDLWPDTIATTDLRGAGRLVPLIGLLCDFVYRSAAAIVVQSVSMRRELIDRGVPEEKLTTILNWAEIELPSSPPAAEPERPFTIVYGGNFGRAQALETVVDAASIIGKRGRDVRIQLYGDGVEDDLLRSRAAASGADVLHFGGRVSGESIIELFAGADALLMHLADAPLFRVTIPSKTQVYLAMGRPIVAGVAGEAADILGRSGAALVVPPNDASALADAICELADTPAEQRAAMAASGARFYRENLDFDNAMTRYLEVLDSTRGVQGRVGLAAAR